jgi:hypothetical protein
LREIFQKVSQPAIDEFAEAIEAASARNSVPSANQSSVVSVDAPKTAALCFDRVWTGLRPDVPDEIAFQSGTNFEIEALTILSVPRLIDQIERQLGRPELELRERTIQAYQRRFTASLDFELMFERLISEMLYRERGIRTATVFASTAKRDKEYKPGSTDVVVAVLQNLAIIDEEKLKWDQVKQFRGDKTAVNALRRLTHWLDAEMYCKSVAFVEDEIASRLFAYDRALRTHGVETALGTLQNVIDGKFLAGAAAAAATATFAGSTVWGAIAGGALVVGKVAVEAIRARLDLDALRYDKFKDINFVIQAREIQK